MIEILKIATNLVPGEEGIWVSKSQSRISYPDGGNVACYKVEDHSFWFKHRNKCILEIIRAFPPGGPLFDVGGGNGYVSWALHNAGVETVLVEPGEMGVANARARGLRPILHSTLQDAGFGKHVLPAVGLFDVLEHIEDDAGFLKTVHKHLLPSGRIYLTVPAYQWLWSVADEDAGHYRRYSLKSLLGTLSLAGFEMEFGSYYFVSLIAPIFFFRHLPSRLGIRKRQEIEDYKEELAQPSQPMYRFLARLLDFEFGALERGNSLPFGGSCLVVARSN